MRAKAWERERGLASRIARCLSLRPQTVRRWLLEPGHRDRRKVSRAADRRQLALRFKLFASDFAWQPGEQAERRRLQRLARAR